jgi:hypothetical protein
MKTASLGRTVLAQNVADNIIQDLLRVQPDGNAEILTAQLRRLFRWNFEPRFTPTKIRSRVGLSPVADGLQSNGSAHDGMMPVAGPILRISRQQPVRGESPI